MCKCCSDLWYIVYGFDGFNVGCVIGKKLVSGVVLKVIGFKVFFVGNIGVDKGGV